MIMSSYRIISSIAFFMLFFLGVHGKTIKDTISTTDGDRIILTYDMSRLDNQVTVRFTKQQKKLGRINADEYKDLDKVAVMFFDRTGNFSSKVSITNMVPEAIMVPSNVRYEVSSDGYFVIQDSPTLTFNVKDKADITIPIYLAYHPKKGKYTLFSKSKGLILHLGSNVGGSNSSQTQTTITSTVEVEGEDPTTIKVLESIALVKNILDDTDKLPFNETLIDEINYLRQKKRDVTDSDLSKEIADALDRYEAKKASLEDKATADQLAAQQAAELKAKQEADELKAQNDSIAAAQEEKAEQEKKKNLWMMIGAGILAVLGFIGNQILKNFQNKKNQKNLMEMQQNMAKKAEEEAKKRAESAIRNATNKTVGGAKRKVSDEVRKASTIKINGKSKNLSI